MNKPIMMKKKLNINNIFIVLLFLPSKVYAFISHVNQKNKRLLPIAYWLFICSQNNGRLHWWKGSWC